MPQKKGSKNRSKKAAAKKSRRDARKKDVKPRKIRTLQDRLQDIYKQVNLETTCCRQCVCCSVSCPQMNYSEATQILDRIWNEWDREAKKKLLTISIDYFFSNSMVKPCPLLGIAGDGKPGCLIYEDRPLNCRVYGQWPADSYERRVETFKDATGFDRSQLPLNTQCPHVRRVEGDALDEETINGLFSEIDALDKKIGDFSEAQMEQRYNYRPIHDWVLAKFWGDENLVFWTEVFHAMKKEEIEALVNTLHQQVEQMVL